MMYLVIHRHIRSGRDGDRAREETRYYDYVVLLGKEGSVKPIPIQVFPGYDNVHCHILPDTLSAAVAYATKIANYLQIGVRDLETYEWKIPTEIQPTWVRVDERGPS